MSEVSPTALAKLRSLPGTVAEVHLVLEEDEYETKFGDGRFLYPRAAFLEAAQAAAGRDQLAKKGYAYHLKAVTIARDEMKNVIVTDDEYSLKDIVRLLA